MGVVCFRRAGRGCRVQAVVNMPGKGPKWPAHTRAGGRWCYFINRAAKTRLRAFSRNFHKVGNKVCSRFPGGKFKACIVGRVCQLVGQKAHGVRNTR